jgi:hypothetical protein
MEMIQAQKIVKKLAPDDLFIYSTNILFLWLIFKKKQRVKLTLKSIRL